MTFFKQLFVLCCMIFSCSVSAMDWSHDHLFMKLFFEGCGATSVVANVIVPKIEIISFGSGVETINSEELIRLSKQFDSEMRDPSEDSTLKALASFVVPKYFNHDKSEQTIAAIKQYCSFCEKLIEDHSNFQSTNPDVYDCTPFCMAVSELIFSFLNPNFTGKLQSGGICFSHDAYTKEIAKCFFNQFIRVAFAQKLKCTPNTLPLFPEVMEKLDIRETVSPEEYYKRVSSQCNDATFACFAIKTAYYFAKAINANLVQVSC